MLMSQRHSVFRLQTEGAQTPFSRTIFGIKSCLHLTMKTLRSRLFWLLLTTLAHAAQGSVFVTPSEAYLSPTQNEATFTVVNQTDQPLIFNFGLSPWQANGVDTEADEQAMLNRRVVKLSSTQTPIPANSKINITVSLNAGDIDDLSLFRLNVNWHSASDQDNLHSLVHSLPVFITGENAKERVHYRTAHRGNDHYLILENHGSKPAHINAYRWQNGKAIPFYAYAWPGVTRYFKLPKGGEGEITLNISGLGWVYSDDALQYVSIY